MDYLSNSMQTIKQVLMVNSSFTLRAIEYASVILATAPSLEHIDLCTTYGDFRDFYFDVTQ